MHCIDLHLMVLQVMLIPFIECNALSLHRYISTLLYARDVVSKFHVKVFRAGSVRRDALFPFPLRSSS